MNDLGISVAISLLLIASLVLVCKKNFKISKWLILGALILLILAILNGLAPRLLLVSLGLVSFFTMFGPTLAIIALLIASFVLMCKKKFKLSICFISLSILFYLVFHWGYIIGMWLAFRDWRIIIN